LYFPIFFNQPTNKPFINSETGEIIPRLTNIRTLEMEQIFSNFLKDFPPNLKKLYHSVMLFVSNCFSKPINSSNHWNYLLSAYLADKFFNTIEDGKIEAIYYPSVPDKLNSENLAIKPAVFDRIYKLSKIQESIVFQDPTNRPGGYAMDAVANCTNFNFETNEIFWSGEKYNFSEEKFEYYKKTFGLDLD
jgi:hypothetical protein